MTPVSMAAGIFTQGINYYGIHVEEIGCLPNPRACHDRCVQYNGSHFKLPFLNFARHTSQYLIFLQIPCWYIYAENLKGKFQRVKIHIHIPVKDNSPAQDNFYSCAERPGQICDSFVFCNKTTCQDRFPGGAIPMPYPFGGCALQWQGGINASTRPVTNYACGTDYGAGKSGPSGLVCCISRFKKCLSISIGRGFLLSYNSCNAEQ